MIMKRPELCVCVFFTVFSSVISVNHDDHFHLPKHVIPTDYELWIKPDLIEGTYIGTVVITVNVLKPTDSIILHSKNLTITSAKIANAEARVLTDVECDFLILKQTLKQRIAKGMYNITIAFAGDMKNKTYGFYRGTTYARKSKRFYGTTFFEPTNARNAFPCFDEPQLKAKFSIKVVRKEEHVALSNMDYIGETLEPSGDISTNFKKTPPMSTYLVAFFVGEAYFTEASVEESANYSSRPTRIYRPASREQRVLLFATAQLPKLLLWFQGYTGIAWRLRKLDYLALPPRSHIDGGMENWGLITGRVNNIDYKSGLMSLLKTRCAKEIAHEIAHEWFGNLVTTSSWGQFWLNEGFARFMDLKVNDLYTEFEERISDYSRTLHKALWRDDDLTALPLVRTLKKRLDVYEILHVLNYEKGGSILQMTENVIGKEVMQKVLHTYLNKFQYQSVTSQDFIDVLQDFVKFNATDFLDGFLKQPGYPIILARINRDNSVTLYKKRFLRFGQRSKEGRWTVPVKYITNLSNKPKFVWFPSNSTKMNLKFSGKIKWVKLNYQQGAYYRSHYCYDTWHNLIAVIKNFTVEDRINILDDAMATVRQGSLPCGIALNATTYLRDGERIEVWETAQQLFGRIRRGLQQHNISIEPLKAYVSDLVDKEYKKYSWDVDRKETYPYKRSRFIIFKLACSYGHKHCWDTVEELRPNFPDLKVDIRNIIRAIDSNTSRIEPHEDTLNSLEKQSVWFGADLTKLTLEPVFKWPIQAMNNCNRWLKKQETKK